MSAEPRTIVIAPNGWVPNSRLPVLVHAPALPTSTPNLASAFEATFDRNGWPAQWRDGVFGYHHYHSTAHEVLGFAAGTATIMLGGPGGTEVRVSPGDVAVLPAGTGHCLIVASDDFLVVGGYPRGHARWDICRAAPTADMRARIEALAVPGADPVLGRGGALTSLWRRP